VLPYQNGSTATKFQKKTAWNFGIFFQKSKDEGTVRLKVNAQTVVLARKLINLSTCF